MLFHVEESQCSLPVLIMLRLLKSRSEYNAARLAIARNEYETQCILAHGGCVNGNLDREIAMRSCKRSSGPEFVEEFNPCTHGHVIKSIHCKFCQLS